MLSKTSQSLPPSPSYSQRLGYRGRGVGRYPGRSYTPSARHNWMLGTPSYPTPLDRLRSSERDQFARSVGRALGHTQGESGEGHVTAMRSSRHLEGPDAEGDVATRCARGALQRCVSRDMPQCKLDNFTGEALLLQHKLQHYLWLAGYDGRGMRDVSFSSVFPPSSLMGSSRFLPETSQNLSDSWALYNYVSAASRPTQLIHSVRNPNKALCTINARTSEILTANDMSAALFSVPVDDLIGQRLSSFVKLKYKNTEVTENHLEDTGTVVEVSGRVLECVDSTGLRIPVSMWLKAISDGPSTESPLDPKCLVVMEPVERLVSRLVVNGNGTILAFDRETRGLFECSDDYHILDSGIDSLISGIKAPFVAESKKLKLSATGKTLSGKTFPCFTVIRHHPLHAFSKQELEDMGQHLQSLTENQTDLFLVTVWVFANISGLLTVLPCGRIHSCNATLASLLFGYSLDDLLSSATDISDVITDFFTPVSLDTADNRHSNWLWEEEEYDMALPNDVIEESTESADNLDTTDDLLEAVEAEVARAQSMTPLSPSSHSSHHHSGPLDDTNELIKAHIEPIGASDESLIRSPHITSTPSRPNQHKSSGRIASEGSFRGVGIHKDGSKIDLIYAVRKVEFESASEDENYVWVVWVSRDPERDVLPMFAFSLSCSSVLWPSRQLSYDTNAHAHSSLHEQLSNAEIATMFEPSGSRHHSCQSQASCPPPPPAPDTFVEPPLLSSIQRQIHVMSTDMSDESVDPFDLLYQPLTVIGKGAFGFVRLAKRVRDNTEVVVKYINKSKLTPDHLVRASMWPGERGGPEEVRLVPREIWLLWQLDHPCIVSLLDWAELELNYTLVMPKHGAGMDLFEFIDRSPTLDEPLVSFIFRQLVDAVSYMHSCHIAHRDIKDENIILDDKFRIKLIDFGAAVRVQTGHKFRTFCGTMEFCSPEILLGNEYDCLSADVWSMGITLYTLNFGQNPFYDYEETIQAVLKPPGHVTIAMLEVLSWMLDPNPETRATAEQLTHHPWITQKVDVTQYAFSTVLPNSEFQGNVASDFREHSVEEEEWVPQSSGCPESHSVARVRGVRPFDLLSRQTNCSEREEGSEDSSWTDPPFSSRIIESDEDDISSSQDQVVCGDQQSSIEEDRSREKRKASTDLSHNFHHNVSLSDS